MDFQIVEVSNLQTLTETELEILRLMSEGLTAIEIAQSRTVSITTVRTQIKNVLRKLHVGTQLKAVAVLHKAQKKRLCLDCKQRWEQLAI